MFDFLKTKTFDDPDVITFICFDFISDNFKEYYDKKGHIKRKSVHNQSSNSSLFDVGARELLGNLKKFPCQLSHTANTDFLILPPFLQSFSFKKYYPHAHIQNLFPHYNFAP